MNLILSLFQGIGMLDDGFVKNGFCVVSGPEQILNGDVRNFKGVENKFDGVIGGSPCQSFSKLNRNPDGYSLEMLNEFCRIVSECQPRWFLLENVTTVPDVHIIGYHVQRFNLSPIQLGFNQSRNRTFQFGSKEGLLIQLPKLKPFNGKIERCAVASEGKKNEKRTFDDFCKLQGFSETPKLDNFNKIGKYRAVGNGVHLGVSNVIARYIKETVDSQNPVTIYNSKTCLCGCGQIVPNSKKTFSDKCRKKLSLKRNRDRAALSAPG